MTEKVDKRELSQEAYEYLKEKFQKRKEQLLRDIANCPYDKPEVLLGLKTELKSLLLLEQQLLLDIYSKEE